MANLAALYSTQVRDYLGVETTSDMFLQIADTTTLASISSTLQGYQALFDDLTGGVQTKAYLRIEIPFVGGLRSTPVEGDEAEMTGLFNFSQSATPYKYGIDIPALNGLLVTNGKIDLSNAAITSWVTWLESAHSGVQAISKFLYTLVALLDAMITFRKHRKAENRRSVETP